MHQCIVLANPGGSGVKSNSQKQQYSVNTVKCCYLEVSGCKIALSGQSVEKIRNPDSHHVLGHCSHGRLSVSSAWLNTESWDWISLPLCAAGERATHTLMQQIHAVHACSDTQFVPWSRPRRVFLSRWCLKNWKGPRFLLRLDKWNQIYSLDRWCEITPLAQYLPHYASI